MRKVALAFAAMMLVSASPPAGAQNSAERAVEAAKQFAGITLNVTWEAGLQANDPLNFSGPMWEELTGIKINVVGLELDEVRTISTLQNGNRVLVVGGRINSVVGRTVTVPPIRVSLIGTNGVEIYNWRVRTEARELKAGETFKFETQLAAPPLDARAVRLSFDTMRFVTRNDGETLRAGLENN